MSQKDSILDKSPSAILGWPISKDQKVIFCYLVPSIVSCLIYIVHIAADIVLTYEHYLEKNYYWAHLTLTFIYLPAFACFVLTITTPQLWPQEDGCCKFINIKWFFVRVGQHVLFPVWVMYRYAERIFWAIEAVRFDDDEREEALWHLNKPRAVELYRFLQAYMQAAPQLLLQIHILMRQDDFYRSDRVNMQALSIIMSMVKMALTTSAYQHYESQKLIGIRYPWSRVRPYMPFPMRTAESVENEIETDSKEEMENSTTIFEDPEIYEDPAKYRLSVPESQRNDTTTTDSIQFTKYKPMPIISSQTDSVEYRKFTPKSERKYSFETDIKHIDSLSTNSSDSDYLSLPESDMYTKRKTAVLPDAKRISEVNSQGVQNLATLGIEDEASTSDAYLSKQTSYVSSILSPPPYPPPPRPDEKDDSAPSTNQRTEYVSILPEYTLSPSPENLVLPVRKYPKKGREPDDAIAKFVAFTWWFFFIVVRILTISAFGCFYQKEAFYFCLAHYVIMVIFLFEYTHSKHVNRNTVFLFLGFVYLFCIMEFRVRFKYIYRTYVCYIIFVFTENFILIVVWLLKDWESWWFYFILYVIIGSTIISVASMLLYLKLLKPNKIVIYD